MKFVIQAAIGAMAVVPAAAGAQAAPAVQPGAAADARSQAAATATAAVPTVGATVYDSAGAVLGTVDQVTPQAVYVNVDGTKVGLPTSAIGAGPQGFRIATTRADILSQAQAAQAAQKAQLTAGATVRGSAGATVGTIKSIDADYVTLTTPRGDVKLPANAVAAGPNGPTIGMTAAELDAAIAQAGGAATK